MHLDDIDIGEEIVVTRGDVSVIGQYQGLKRTDQGWWLTVRLVDGKEGDYWLRMPVRKIQTVNC